MLLFVIKGPIFTTFIIQIITQQTNQNKPGEKPSDVSAFL